MGRLVFYLKWGNLSGAYYHCGNLGPFTKKSPSVIDNTFPLIPSYLESNILVPAEEVFGKLRLSPPSDSLAFLASTNPLISRG